MPVVAASGKQRRGVRFPSNNQRYNSVPATSSKSTSLSRGGRTSRTPSSRFTSREAVPTPLDTRGNRMATRGQDPRPGIPDLFTQRPVIRDPLVTETSKVQDATVDECLPFLKGLAKNQDGPFNQFGVAKLDRDEHIAFLYDSLEMYPSGFVALDASRPWMVYWALAGLYLLGEDVTKYRERVIASAAPMQNSSGGFGGGHGQMPHCASSYAMILSLAMVGGEEAFNLINRTTLWEWLGQLKQPDGGFQVCVGGEEDVRGAYCVMVIVALLDLPLELSPNAPARKFGHTTFMSGLPEYLSRCQTFEGGISGSPGTEAHGAYAFCALACLCILGEPDEMINKYIDLPLLISWLSARQSAPESGFAGRTNKLVDGCYSHWVGGCWPLIQAALTGAQTDPSAMHAIVGNLYSREGLTRYILNCCQSQQGGLRDKPGKYPDSYHTCYVLAGLSNTQTCHFNTGVAADSSASHISSFPSAFSWLHAPFTSSSEKEQDSVVFDEGDRLEVVHPLFVIPHRAAADMQAWFHANKTGPSERYHKHTGQSR
ncbi:hypothetical protein AJ80_01021 [Polytolypa hystricis UAMH7299]|uniref:Protein farnesyltransferase subunit beta n=1 Tax=Polytolypa hystricis (strain UAMH7299) TaxID=1447883 RepID=A0A2B7Z1W1_POLH7|nr:hypothetical protein AJ80_01021 [Polytolypa hystricis UAMH7299]